MKRFFHLLRSASASKRAGLFGPRAILRPDPRQLLVELLEDRTVPTLTMSVVNPFDNGSDSLRDAILKANDYQGTDDVIIQLWAGETFSLGIANTNGQENEAKEGDLDITNTAHRLIIDGTAIGEVNGSPAIIDAFAVDRVFHIVKPGIEVVFKNLIIQGGLAQDDGSDGAAPGTTTAVGGAILSDGGIITLENVIIRSSTARGGVGAPGTNHPDSSAQPGHAGEGGGVWAHGGSLTLFSSSITGNRAIGGVGGVGAPGQVFAVDFGDAGGFGGAARGGGIYAADADVILQSSTVRGNRATGGAGGDGGVGDPTSDYGGVPGGHGGIGGDAEGGGLYTVRGALAALFTSTVISNRATAGDGGEGGSDGGNGGEGGAARGGGIYGDGSDVILSESDLFLNRALGGDGGAGTDAPDFDAPNIPDAHGLNTSGGHAGVGGVAQGGGFFGQSAEGSLFIDAGRVSLNVAVGGDGGVGGDGADVDDTFAGDAGAGGDGGRAQGGGLFVGNVLVNIRDTIVVTNSAEGGAGGAGGDGGVGEVGGDGGEGGQGASGQGGGLFADDARVTLTQSRIQTNTVKGGRGGNGGDGGDATDSYGAAGHDGGDGGAAQGGGLFATSGTISLASVEVLGNRVAAGAGGDGGDGGDGSSSYVGDGGAGGAGGNSQGGGLFVGRAEANLTDVALSRNVLAGGDGGRGGSSGDGSELVIGIVGAIGECSGGNGGVAQGGGLFTNRGSVNISDSVVEGNRAAGGHGGNGGDAGDNSDGQGFPGGHGGDGGAAQGGGLFVQRATLTLGGSPVLGNQVVGGNGAKGGKGGWSTDATGGPGGEGGNGGAGQGGGLFAGTGMVSLTNETLAFNSVTGGQGGRGRIGGPGSDAGGGGGNGGHGGHAQGGGLFADGPTVTLTSSTVSQNSVAPGDGAKGGAGGMATDGSGGNAGSGGPGGNGQGGGLFIAGGELTIVNSTISTNSAEGSRGGNGGKGGNGTADSSGGNGGHGGHGGAVQGGGIYLGAGSLTLRNATIAFNTLRANSKGGSGGPGGSGDPKGIAGAAGTVPVDAGGGVFKENGFVDAANTILAKNAATNAPDFSGLIDVVKNNLLGIGDGSQGVFDGVDGNIVGSASNPIDPKLGPLVNNGGPTQTHALKGGSPAINAGDNGLVPTGVTTDQRGPGFDRIEGGTVDIGAFEVQTRRAGAPPGAGTGSGTGAGAGGARNEIRDSFTAVVDPLVAGIALSKDDAEQRGLFIVHGVTDGAAMFGTLRPSELQSDPALRALIESIPAPIFVGGLDSFPPPKDGGDLLENLWTVDLSIGTNHMGRGKSSNR